MGEARSGRQLAALATDGTGNLAAQSSVLGGGTVHLVMDVTGYFE